MSVQSQSTAAPPSGRRRTRSRRGLVLLAGLVAVLALVGASCRQLDPANRAAGVPAVTNGSLPMSHLSSTVKGCIVYDEAINSLNAMVAQAAKDGVTLKPLSCYRDYAGQVAAREDWCAKGACHMAAVPGTSNHGWGKAIDFRDQHGSLDFDSAGYLWLKTWAGHYGWIHPKVMEADGPVPEAWHWEWIGDGGKMFLGEYFGIGNAPMAVPRGLPFGHLEMVSPVDGGVSIVGWAIDPDQVASIPIHVYIDGAWYGLVADVDRPDVGAVYPLYAAEPHGFSATFPAAPGPRNVCVHALNVAGTGFNLLLSCRTVTVLPPAAPTAAPSTTTTTTTVPSAPVADVSTPPTSTSTTSTTQAAAPGSR